MEEMDIAQARVDLQQHYIGCWRDTLNQLNSTTDDDAIKACKEHLSWLVSEDWFTEAVIAEEIAEINAVLV